MDVFHLLCSFFVLLIFSMISSLRSEGLDIGSVNAASSVHIKKHDSRNLDHHEAHLPHRIKKRIIAKLRKLISNVRSINKSLKDEISMLQVDAGKSAEHGETNYEGSGQDIRSSLKVGLSKSHINQPEQLEKSRQSLNTVRQSIPVPAVITPHPVSKTWVKTAVTNSTQIKSKPTTNPVIAITDQQTSTPAKSLSGCSTYKSEAVCSQNPSCHWCSLAEKCLNHSELNSGPCSRRHNATKGKSHNKSINRCYQHEKCKPCIKVSNCVWCQSAKTCLLYTSREVLAVDCPNNKWYWKSCPYQPTILLIMLPVLMTLSLLILIAICIKYYRSYKKKVYYKEEQGLTNQLFKWKGKSRIYAAGPGEHEEFLADKVRKKYHIVDHRKKQRPESPSELVWKKPEKLSPSIPSDGRRRAGGTYSPLLSE